MKSQIPGLLAMALVGVIGTSPMLAQATGIGPVVVEWVDVNGNADVDADVANMRAEMLRGPAVPVFQLHAEADVCGLSGGPGPAAFPAVRPPDASMNRTSQIAGTARADHGCLQYLYARGNSTHT